MRTAGPSLRFLLATEVHVYAFSIAANVLLSFFPFLLTIVLLCRWVFHWEAGVRAVFFAVSQFFPDYRNGTYLDINGYLNQAAWGRQHVSLFSILLLFFTANGIFEPLEVALNRAWRVPKNRSYLSNQLVSLGLVFFCGVLGLLSTVLIATNGPILGHSLSRPGATAVGNGILLKIGTVPVFALIIFAVYWILPNRRIHPLRLIPVSVIVGILLVALNIFYLSTWPWLLLKLRAEVGPFVHSVSIILWSFVGSMILLAGAEWSARVTLDTPEQRKDTPEKKEEMPGSAAPK